MKNFAFLIAVITLAACANTDTALMRESAMAIGNHVRPDDVKLQNVDRGAMSVTWDAVTPKGAYNCSADDMLRKVLCVTKNK